MRVCLAAFEQLARQHAGRRRRGDCRPRERDDEIR